VAYLQFEPKDDLESLTSSVAEFIPMVGDRWKRRAVQLITDAARSPFLSRIVEDYHWLEVALSEQMLAYETTKRLTDRLGLSSLAALYFGADPI
jgi:hypothetical protein